MPYGCETERFYLYRLSPPVILLREGGARLPVVKKQADDGFEVWFSYGYALIFPSTPLAEIFGFCAVAFVFF